MAELSEWLKLMLAEIARKRDEEAQARAEQAQAPAEQAQAPAEDTARTRTRTAPEVDPHAQQVRARRRPPDPE